MTPLPPHTPETANALAAQNSPPPSPRPFTRWIRPVRRGLALLFAGVLAREALDPPSSPPPPPPRSTPASFERLSPAEQRYHERLRATLADIRRRWPDHMPPLTIGRSGTVAVTPPSQQNGDPLTINAQQNGNAITITIDRTGTLTFLREQEGSTTIELRPEHHDLRRTDAPPEQTVFHWTMKDESLFGQCSHDGAFRSLFIEGEGQIDPQSPPAALSALLSTPHRVFLFQRIFATYEAPCLPDGTLDVPLFLRTFRRNLAEWQHDGYRNGACNTYAETACEVLAGDRFAMHILTLWPQGNKLQEWHQTAGFPLQNGTWCIIDVPMERLEYTTPELFARSIGMEVATTPVLGRLPWTPERRGPFFRFLQHLQPPSPRRRGSG